jgi:hypothetical protein
MQKTLISSILMFLLAAVVAVEAAAMSPPKAGGKKPPAAALKKQLKAKVSPAAAVKGKVSRIHAGFVKVPGKAQGIKTKQSFKGKSAAALAVEPTPGLGLDDDEPQVVKSTPKSKSAPKKVTKAAK